MALVIASLASCNWSAGESSTSLPGVFSQQPWTGDVEQVRFPEPSGLTFHTGRGTLFVVGDEGHLGEIDLDGNLLNQERIRNADFEGITWNPATGYLYIAVEGAEMILEVDPDSLKVLREFEIERTFGDTLLLAPGGNGVEAITFVPNPDHPQGGTFYLANQGDSLDDEDDLSVIVEVEVPLNGPDSDDLIAPIINHFSIGVTDLSGLYYDSNTGALYVISDDNDILIRLTTVGEVLALHPLPGEDQEGIAVDDMGNFYIAQDSGAVIKLAPAEGLR